MNKQSRLKFIFSLFIVALFGLFYLSSPSKFKAVGTQDIVEYSING